MRRDRRVKYAVMLLAVIGASLGLLATTQPWYAIHLVAAANHSGAVSVQGSKAAGALTTLSLAGYALVGALAIAGRAIRVVLGALGIVLGGCLVLATSVAISDPLGAAGQAVTAVTGVSGRASVEALVARVDESLWPVCAIAGGVVLALAGLGVLVTGRRWPGSARRYQAVGFAPADEAHEASRPAEPATESVRDHAIDDWDELSRGDDPTR